MKSKNDKKITLEFIAKSINDLAVATAKGFEEVNGKIDRTEKTLGGKIEGIDRRIDDLAFNRATKDEVYVLTQRVVRVEKKVGIKV